MVVALFDERMREDGADALALGHCHYMFLAFFRDHLQQGRVA